MKRTLRSTRILLVLGLIALVSGAAYAFTASNTVPVSYAGSGNGTINGYTVTEISYTLDGTTPTNFSTMTLALDSKASDVKVQLAPSGTWYDCGATSGTVDGTGAYPLASACSISGESVAGATQLTVVAVQ